MNYEKGGGPETSSMNPNFASVSMSNSKLAEIRQSYTSSIGSGEIIVYETLLDSKSRSEAKSVFDSSSITNSANIKDIGEIIGDDLAIFYEKTEYRNVVIVEVLQGQYVISLQFSLSENEQISESSSMLGVLLNIARIAASKLPR